MGNAILNQELSWEKVPAVFRHFCYWNLEDVQDLFLQFQQHQKGFGFRVDLELFEKLFSLECQGNIHALAAHYDEYEAEKDAASGLLLQLEVKGDLSAAKEVHDTLLAGYKPLLIPSPYVLWRAFGGRPRHADQRQIATTSAVSLIDVMCVLVLLCDASDRKPTNLSAVDPKKPRQVPSSSSVPDEREGAQPSSFLGVTRTGRYGSWPDYSSSDSPERKKLVTLFHLFDTPIRGVLSSDNFEDLVRSVVSAIARILRLPIPPLAELKLLLATPLLSSFVAAASVPCPMTTKNMILSMTRGRVKASTDNNPRGPGKPSRNESSEKSPLNVNKFLSLVMRSPTLSTLVTTFQRRSIVTENLSGSLAPHFIQLLGYEFRTQGGDRAAAASGTAPGSDPLKLSNKTEELKAHLQLQTLSKGMQGNTRALTPTQDDPLARERTALGTRLRGGATSDSLMKSQLIWPPQFRMGPVALRAASRFIFSPKTTIKDVQYLSMLFDSLDPAGIGFVNMSKLKRVHSSSGSGSGSGSTSSSTGFSALRDIDLAVSSIFSDSGIQARVAMHFVEQRKARTANSRRFPSVNYTGESTSSTVQGVNPQGPLSDPQSLSQVQRQLQQQQQQLHRQTADALSQYEAHIVLTLNEAKRLVASSIGDCEASESANVDAIIASLSDPSDSSIASNDSDLLSNDPIQAPMSQLTSQPLFISFPFMLDIIYCDLTPDQRRILHSWIPKQIDRGFVQRLQRLFDRIDSRFEGRASLSSCIEAMRKVDEFNFFAKRLMARKTEIANALYYSSSIATGMGMNIGSSGASSDTTDSAVDGLQVGSTTVNATSDVSLSGDSYGSTTGTGSGSGASPGASSSSSTVASGTGLQNDVKLTFRELLNNVLLEVPQSQWKRAQAWVRPIRQLTPEQRDALAVRFRLLDQSGRGKIPLSALINSIVESNRQEGIHLTAEEISDLVRDVVTDSNGEIDLVEFQLFYRDASSPVINFLLDCFDNPFFVPQMRQNRTAAAFSAYNNSASASANMPSSLNNPMISNMSDSGDSGVSSDRVSGSNDSNTVGGKGSEQNLRPYERFHGKQFPVPPPAVPSAVSRLYVEIEQYRKLEDEKFAILAGYDPQAHAENDRQLMALIEAEPPRVKVDVLPHLLEGYKLNEGINRHVQKTASPYGDLSSYSSLDDHKSTSDAVPLLQLRRGITIGPSLRASASLMLERPKILLSTGHLVGGGISPGGASSLQKLAKRK